MARNEFVPVTPGEMLKKRAERCQVDMGNRPTHQCGRMPSGQTSRPELQANDQCPNRSGCSEIQRGPICRSHHERRPGARTTDAKDKRLRETRFRGRSQALLYNRRRPHTSLDGTAPDQAYFDQLPLRAAA
jgi:hypothetical protein